MRKIYFLLAGLVFLIGCATTLKPGMVWMYTKPSVKCEKDPGIDFNKYKNFSVFPQAEFDKEKKINPIVEKQLLFILRNTLEVFGYNYVTNPEEADFVVAVTYSNEYKSQYVPPSSYTMPWYVPGQTQTTFINNYNSFSGNIDSKYFYGSGSGWGTATTTTLGYYVPMAVTNPGGYVGWYYPCIFVSILDKNSKNLVWSGSAVGTTSQEDIRLSGQVLLGQLFGGKEPDCPISSELNKKLDEKNGAIGINVASQTLDGNNFYPTIFTVTVGSPAYKQGLKPLDIITQVNKQNTLNWAFSDIYVGIRKNKGESVNLTIKRGDKMWDVTIVAEDIEKAKKEWKEVLTLDEKWNTKTIKIPKSQ